MKRFVALGIVFLALAFQQVQCGGFENVSFVIRQLNASEKCLNVSVHPSRNEKCPLATFPYLDQDYSVVINEMSGIGLSESKLSPDCFKTVLRTLCIMTIPICTADGFAVGMFGHDICMKYLECGEPVFGNAFLQGICGFVSLGYTNVRYNGTDPPTYFVSQQQAETGTASLVYNPLALHVMLTILVLQFLAKLI